MIVAVLVATLSAQAPVSVAAVSARPMTAAEMSAVEGGLTWYECFLLGVAIGLACGGTGGLGCAIAVAGGMGTGGLDCLS
jgi:hypothetical protein